MTVTEAFHIARPLAHDITAKLNLHPCFVGKLAEQHESACDRIASGIAAVIVDMPSPKEARAR